MNGTVQGKFSKLKDFYFDKNSKYQLVPKDLWDVFSKTI